MPAGQALKRYRKNREKTEKRQRKNSRENKRDGTVRVPPLFYVRYEDFY
jgi:hypothetical protein